MGASTVSSGWSNHFIELLDIFHIKNAPMACLRHWTGLRTAGGIVARQWRTPPIHRSSPEHRHFSKK